MARYSCPGVHSVVRVCIVFGFILVVVSVSLFKWIFTEPSRIITFFVIVGIITSILVGNYIHRRNKKRTLRALLLDAKDEEMRKQIENTAKYTLEEHHLDYNNLQGGQAGIELNPRDTTITSNIYGTCSHCGRPRMSQTELFCSNCGNRF